MASSATSGFRGSRSFALDAVRVQDFNADIRGATGATMITRPWTSVRPVRTTNPAAALATTDTPIAIAVGPLIDVKSDAGTVRGRCRICRHRTETRDGTDCARRERELDGLT